MVYDEEELEKFEKYDGRFDVLKDLIKIHSPIKKTLSADLKLAKFTNEKDRQYVIELLQAWDKSDQFIYNHLRDYKRFQEKYGWDEISQEDIKVIKQRYRNIEASFLNRIHALAVLSVNVPNNWFVKNITGNFNTEIDEEEPGNMQKMAEAAKKKLANQEKKLEETT